MADFAPQALALGRDEYVLGHDVSHWQPIGLAIAGWYVWIKTSQGTRGRDHSASGHHAHYADRPRGAYHFADLGSPALANADNLLRAMAGLPWELRPVCDIEKGSAGSKAATTNWLCTFNERIHDQAGVWPLDYSYLPYMVANVNGDARLLVTDFWGARYPNVYKDGHVPPSSDMMKAAEPWHAAGREPIAWQYATTGNLDHDVVRRGYLSAISWSGKTSPTPTPAPTEGSLTMADIATLTAKLDTLQHQVQTLLDSQAQKAVALRDKSDGKVYIVSPAGKFWVQNMDDLNLLIFTGQVHGLGTDGKVAEVPHTQLDSIPLLDKLA